MPKLKVKAYFLYEFEKETSLSADEITDEILAEWTDKELQIESYPDDPQSVYGMFKIAFHQFHEEN